MQHLQPFIHSCFSLTWWKPVRKLETHELDGTILNAGLSIALQYNGTCLLPVQSQLCDLFPELELHELDQYNEVCQNIIETGRTLAHQPDRQSRSPSTLPASRTQTQNWKNYYEGMRHHHAWISEDNLHLIYTKARQGGTPRQKGQPNLRPSLWTKSTSFRIERHSTPRPPS